MQELSEALTCKYFLSFSKGGCDGVFLIYFTMEIFILHIFVSLFLFACCGAFRGTIVHHAFGGSTDTNSNVEARAYQNLETSKWDILAATYRVYI